MTIPQLRPYQQALKDEVQAEWAAGHRNVLMRLDTGGGKTVILSSLLRDNVGGSCAIAHRAELVYQLSLALAANGVRHNIIAAKADAAAIARAHLEEFGACFYDPGSRIAVASIDTLVRAKNLGSWPQTVTLWIVDEGHHLVEDNKWHKGISLFTNPHCRGLLPTATPARADGKGLGRHADGVADVMVQGPPMRWLIDQGYLTPYKVFCPTSDMVLMGDVPASGDWSPKQLREAARKSHIVGDVVTSALQFAPGKLHVTFAPDIETAKEITQAFQAAGVRAELLTGDTDRGYRRQILRQFKARQVQEIVAVDIISEGFDLPAIEAVSFARRTESLALYMQQFGRALRPMSGKERAIIIDHVGNWVRHLAPDRPRPWSLDARERKSKGPSDAIPQHVCTDPTCAQPYERWMDACPHCGKHKPEPVARSSPEMVDGDLAEVDEETMARMRGEVEAIDMDPVDYHRQLAAKYVPGPGIAANVKRLVAKQEAQRILRAAMGLWGGRQHAAGLSDREMQRLFYLTFGYDVMSAMALGVDEATALCAKVDASVNDRV